MERRPFFITSLMFLTTSMALAARAPIENKCKTPYLGAIVVDAGSGQVLFEDNADATAYPASVLKMMDLLVILEKIQQGSLTLTNQVSVSAEAAQMGGSQVYLKEKELFRVDDLLFALMIQSANDAAVALAEHIAGSKAGFIKLMNDKARALGMKNTVFHSVHGLPPSEGQSVDITTARDLATLACELSKHPETFRYTAVPVRGFRDGAFRMQTHNNLLGQFEGCDGFKTGYFRAAGYSIVATAKREGRRIIAVIVGSDSKNTRDAKAKELLAKGFATPTTPPSTAIAK